MRIIAYLLITLGILTMFYPKLNDLYSAYQQEQFLKAYDSKVIVANAIQARESYDELNQLFEEENEQHMVGKEDEWQDHEHSLLEEKPSSTLIKTADIIGTLEIEKIKLRLPILAGATQSNLRYAAGHLEGTALFGEQGNAAVAAHRSYAYGKLFNRLDELEEGDGVLITSPDSTYEYTVYKKLLVEPTDVSVLKAPKDKSILTLITCHPMKNPTHRLIIQAERR